VDLQLRPYEPEDFEAMCWIDQLCYPPGIAYSKRTMRFYLRAPGAHCIVADSGTEVIGFILGEIEGQSAHIVTIDVLVLCRINN
jgi:ribosomal-protein-alanine N-acetyltransferase